MSHSQSNQLYINQQQNQSPIGGQQTYPIQNTLNNNFPPQHPQAQHPYPIIRQPHPQQPYQVPPQHLIPNQQNVGPLPIANGPQFYPDQRNIYGHRHFNHNMPPPPQFNMIQGSNQMFPGQMAHFQRQPPFGIPPGMINNGQIIQQPRMPAPIPNNDQRQFMGQPNNINGHQYQQNVHPQNQEPFTRQNWPIKDHQPHLVHVNSSQQNSLQLQGQQLSEYEQTFNDSIRQQPLPGIDKFNQNIINSVMQDVEVEINHSNSEGVNNRNIDGAYGIEFPGEHGEEQLGTGQLLGSEEVVNKYLKEFKKLWEHNLQKQCAEAKMLLQQRNMMMRQNQFQHYQIDYRNQQRQQYQGSITSQQLEHFQTQVPKNKSKYFNNRNDPYNSTINPSEQSIQSTQSMQQPNQQIVHRQQINNPQIFPPQNQNFNPQFYNQFQNQQGPNSNQIYRPVLNQNEGDQNNQENNKLLKTEQTDNQDNKQLIGHKRGFQEISQSNQEPNVKQEFEPSKNQQNDVNELALQKKQKTENDQEKKNEESSDEESDGLFGNKQKQEQKVIVKNEQKQEVNESDDDDDGGIFNKKKDQIIKPQIEQSSETKNQNLDQTQTLQNIASKDQNNDRQLIAVQDGQYQGQLFPINPHQNMIPIPKDEIQLQNNLESREEDDSDPSEEHLEDDTINTNTIVAQYKTENRVRSTFKFNLQNAVIFIDGIHYFIKELKAQFQY